MSAEHLFHLALPADWSHAQQAGEYRTSTRGRTLADEGFIHLSFDRQWPATRTRFYGDVDTDLLLLEIDPSGLDIRVEVGNPVTGEQFPHLYGPLPTSAVIDVRTLEPPHNG